MSKIIRAYIEEKPVSLSLLKSINSDPLGEGAFDSLKSAFGGGGKKAAPTPQDDAPDRATTDSASADLSEPFPKLVNEILHTQDDRYVMFTNLGFVSKFYLKAGGGKGAIDSLKSDEAVIDAVTVADTKDFKAKAENAEAPQFELRKLKPNFKAVDLSNIANSSFNAAILIDIPKVLSSELEKEKSSGDAAKIRAVLIKMMSFKYYVATLNLGSFRKVAAKLDSAKTLEEKLPLFNIVAIVANYPVKATWDAAKIEWKNEHNGGEWPGQEKKDEKAGEEGEEKPAEDGAEDGEEKSADKNAVSKTPSGGLDLEKSILDACRAGKGEPEAIAAKLFSVLNKEFDLHTVQNSIIDLEEAFGRGSVLSKLNAILTSQYADSWERKQPAGDKSKPQSEPEAGKPKKPGIKFPNTNAAAGPSAA